jgi:hypothetical protein
MPVVISDIKDKYLARVKEEWLSASNHFPEFLSEISEETKRSNERYLQRVSEEFQRLVKGFPHLPFRRKRWKRKMLNMIHEVLFRETVIGIHRSMDQEELDLLQEELKEFLRHVRSFAPELSFEDIGQAIRNYIVYAMFKEINRRNSGFSMAGFGYSMLYPFTDNYIDSKTYSPEEKAEYNRLIHDKLEGKDVCPKDVYQKKTCELLQAIESNYCREKDSSVFALLLMMLEAQENSIRQQHRDILLSEDERLDISLYKGGVSVLIDRVLTNKELTEEDMYFYLGLGFFLQLADDLQDIGIDSRQGHQTLLTLDLSPAKEEMLANKLLHFIHNITTAYQAENEVFKDFVLANCYQLIYTSIIGSKEFFPKEYLDLIERFLPVCVSSYENVKGNLITDKDSRLQDKYMKMLDDIIFE